MQAGIQGLNGVACGDAVNGFDAAGRAAAGYFFLSGQEKVTKKKAAPEPPTPPALLAEAVARPRRRIPAPRPGSRSRREPR